MGIYLNPGNAAFSESLRSEIYVDKTGLIRYTNQVIETKQKNICVSRPRRFGKSMAAEMLVAYYSCGCSSKSLFEGLEIQAHPDFDKYLNKYNVLFLNIQNFVSRVDKIENLIFYLQDSILEELKECYSEQLSDNESLLVTALEKLYKTSGIEFVFIIDEWDCIFRERKHNTEIQTQYLNFLRDLLKDKLYVKLAYMTGILPIKKYGTHSALNMFDEFSMTDPGILAEYVGFTETEVKKLCQKYTMDFAETQQWYNGYCFDESLYIYSPKSVVDAMRRRKFNSYWTKTETYEALKIYVDMNYDGLKDAIVMMLSGGRCKIDTGTFQNDMTTFSGKDDVLTLLIHLGYLGYNAECEETFIPNEEVHAEFVRAVKKSGWAEIIKSISASEDLLHATWRNDEESVARGIDAVHMETTSILSYNNENSLSCVISLAYYSARTYYSIIREMPAGLGFADIVFLPYKKFSDKPAMILELKWDESAGGAIKQIKTKQYIKALQNYKGTVLLVGINYNKVSKKHQCVIEKINVN